MKTKEEKKDEAWKDFNENNNIILEREYCVQEEWKEEKEKEFADGELSQEELDNLKEMTMEEYKNG